MKQYSNEKNTLILIALLKAHGIKKIVISPGATNVSFVGSVQQDPWFELYSSVDERSAAYIACGLAAESGEPVALSCTGATASRNYMPGLTEAFYRKLPVLALTSTQRTGRIGHYIPQVIDRTVPLNDIVKMSVQIPVVQDKEDEWSCAVTINKALLELNHRGKGPVHINIETTYSKDFSIEELPEVQIIRRIASCDYLPEITGERIAIFVGEHEDWSDELTNAVDMFCSKYNAVVLCDQTGNYRGKYRVLANLVTDQGRKFKCTYPDLLIHIGTVSGAYMAVRPGNVWRVNPDGEIRDTFKKLSHVFEMTETDFFKNYNFMKPDEENNNEYFREWLDTRNSIVPRVPELPFSNPWIAQNTADKLPQNCTLHLGILNSLRSWNLFETDRTVSVHSNTGGFGIDGCVSTLIGASLADSERLYFGIVGDLAFFYDMNVLGNRHIGNNVRIMVINNGKGTEFRNYNHRAAAFGEAADEFMAAARHYGNKSQNLIKHYAEDLGFEYISASNKDEYLKVYSRFVTSEKLDKSVIFEVFTDSEAESDAIKLMKTIEPAEENGSSGLKGAAKNILGESGMKAIKKIIRR